MRVSISRRAPKSSWIVSRELGQRHPIQVIATKAAAAKEEERSRDVATVETERWLSVAVRS